MPCLILILLVSMGSQIHSTEYQLDKTNYFFSLNIFYFQNVYSNGGGSQVLTTLVSTLPLHCIYT